MVITIAVLFLLAGVVVGVWTAWRRAERLRIAHDARMSALAQPYIAAMKKKAMEQASARAAKPQGTESTTPSPLAAREERECPFCAERILKRAKICKHCGREVQQLNE